MFSVVTDIKANITAQLTTTMISACLSIYLMSGVKSFAEALPSLDTVVVEAGTRGLPFSSTYSDIVTLDREEIERRKPATLADLLQSIPDVSFIERGAPGVQSDISIRGSAPENVCIMINGVTLGDPQTGHFQMDLPVDVSAVERIEVIRGGAGPLYGSSAGSVVNIVTTAPNGSTGRITAGSHGLSQIVSGFGRRDESSAFGVSFSGGRSDGYKSDSDFETGGVTLDGSFARKMASLGWNIGYVDKKFGAGGFYGAYPSYERINTLTGSLTGRVVLSGQDMLRLRAGGRGHGDDFILVREQPERYRNTHYNRSFSAAIEYLGRRCDIFDITLGASGDRYGITSSSLGNHADHGYGLYGGIDIHTKPAVMSVSLRYGDDTKGGDVVTHGAGVAVPLGNHVTARVSHSASFRRPTYTEMYYVSPANIGNSSLDSEKTSSFYAGFDYAGERVTCGAGFFRSTARHVIDWVRENKTDPWLAVNHGEIEIEGYKAECLYRINEDYRISLAATVVDRKVRRRAGLTSKYALNHPLETVTTSLDGPLFAGIEAHVSVRYEHLDGLGTRAPVSVNISRPFGDTSFTVALSNAFNERYEAFPDYRAPGRWVWCSFEWKVRG